MNTLEAVLRALKLTPDAVQEMVENVKQAQATHSVKKDETPWEDAVSSWLASHTSSETKRKYERQIQNFYTWVTARHDVEVVGDVTREDAVEYVKFLEKNYSGSTRKNYFWCVVSMFSHQKENCGEENNVVSPFYNVKEPRQKKGEQKKKKKHDVLVQKDVDRLMEKAHSTEAKAYMAFLYFFALRNSEVCRLQKSHLTYHHGNGKDVKEHIVLSGLRVKGTEGENIIGEGHIKDRKVYKKRAIEILAPYCNTTGFVFPGTGTKDHMSERTGFNWVKKAALKAGLRTYTEEDKAGKTRMCTYVSPHWLRHACASVMLHNGARIESISEFLGHAGTKITRTYLHADPDMSAKIDY